MGDNVKHLSAKATRSLNYLRHTLFSCPLYIKAVAYKSLVRPILEYASPVVSGFYLLPHTKRAAHCWTDSSCDISFEVCKHQLEAGLNPQLPACKNWSGLPYILDDLNFHSIQQTLSILYNQYAISSTITLYSLYNYQPLPLFLFANTSFVWNSIPELILGISNHSEFLSALRRFLVI